MSASTSRNGAMAAVRSVRGRISSGTSRVVVPKPALGTQEWTRQPVLRHSSTQPQTQTQAQTKTKTKTKTKETGKGKESDRYNYNTSMSFSEDIDPDVRFSLPTLSLFCKGTRLTELQHVNYRRVTAGDIASRREPPTKVKMLVRDFIDDSLYNVSALKLVHSGCWGTSADTA